MPQKIRAFNSFDLAVLLLRFWLGAIMVKHSTDYLFGGKMEELGNYMSTLNFPLPEITAYASQYVAFVTAVLIILGLRVGALILTFTMGIAVLFAHKMLIFTEGELAFNYFAMSLFIAIAGTGKYGLDSFLKQRRKVA